MGVSLILIRTELTKVKIEFFSLTGRSNGLLTNDIDEMSNLKKF
jgi:hypothetical protein